MTSTEHLEKLLDYLPAGVRLGLRTVPEARRFAMQEIRLRAGRPVTVTLSGRQELLSRDGFTRNPAAALVPSPEDIARTAAALMRYSVHSHESELAAGFLTVYGCRVGLCGTCVQQDGQIRTVRDLSGLNIRIAGEMRGCAEGVFRQLGQAGGVLIAGAPGSGKTTFLRDYCRLLGDSFRTALIDERGEIAAVSGGVPLHDVGLFTDVFDGYPRAAGISTALRVMNPEHILCDELSGEGDAAALLNAAGSGANITASVHAPSSAELTARPVLQKLLDAGMFRYCVFLGGVGQVQSVRRLP